MPSCSHYCSGKSIIVAYSDCVLVNLVIHYEMYNTRATLSSAACPAVQYFSTVFHKRPDFREKKVIDHILCVVDFLYKGLPKKFLILRNFGRITIVNVYWSSCKVALILVRF